MLGSALPLEPHCHFGCVFLYVCLSVLDVCAHNADERAVKRRCANARIKAYPHTDKLTYYLEGEPIPPI